MAQSEMKNAPPLYGWAIAIAAGAVATAISFLVVGIEGNGSVAVGAVIALVVGVIFTIAETPPKPSAKPASMAPKVAAAPAAPVAPVAPVAQPESVSAPATSVAPAAEAEGTKPEMLTAPVGTADDLKQISGVGPVLENKLNELGVYHFWQIARWTTTEVSWVDDAISFKGRITRDDWITQARKLAESSDAKPPA